MTTPIPSRSLTPKQLMPSFRWDIAIPFVVAIAPACIFRLLGLVTRGWDRKVADAPAWIIILIALEILGIIAMALVTIMRLDLSRRQLYLLTAGHPAWWRKSFLILSIACLLLFDILINLSAALAGAEIFLLIAPPFFLAYLLFYYIAFLGTSRSRF